MPCAPASLRRQSAGEGLTPGGHWQVRRNSTARSPKFCSGSTPFRRDADGRPTSCAAAPFVCAAAGATSCTARTSIWCGIPASFAADQALLGGGDLTPPADRHPPSPPDCAIVAGRCRQCRAARSSTAEPRSCRPNYSKVKGRVFYAIGDLTERAKRGKHFCVFGRFVIGLNAQGRVAPLVPPYSALSSRSVAEAGRPEAASPFVNCTLRDYLFSSPTSWP